MRKCFCLILILALISVALLGAGHREINSVKEDVTFIENIAFGNIEEVENITVTAHAISSEHLLWDTVCTFDGGMTAETEFTYSDKEIENNSARSYNGIQIWTVAGFGVSGGSYSENTRYGELFDYVASNTENGTMHSENIELIDYFDYYPLEIEIDIPGFNMYFNETDYSPLFKHVADTINDALAFPVIEGHMCKAYVSKDEDGTIIEYGLDYLDGADPKITSCSAITENALYFHTSAYNSDRTLYDTSGYKYGYGIYAIPTQYNGVTSFKVEELKNAYPLREDVIVEYMTVSEDMKTLYLITREDSKFCLTVIDANSAQELQKIDITDAHPDYGLNYVHVYDDFICLVTQDDNIVVIEIAENGFCSVALDTVLPLFLGEDIYFDAYLSEHMDWDGETLAIVSRYINQESYYYDYGCDFMLTVVDETGLRFMGSYISSLSEPSYEYGNRCQFVAKNPLTIKIG